MFHRHFVLLLPAFQSASHLIFIVDWIDLLLADLILVELLRRHHVGDTMRLTPRIIRKENGTVAQIVRNNEMAVDIVRKDNEDWLHELS